MSKLPSSFDSEDIQQQDFIAKCISQCKQQPFVPLGTLATCVAVTLAAVSLRKGHQVNAQKWFRYRVAFQGFTIAALVVGGIVYGKETAQQKRSREDLLQEKAKLRERLWIEELERRDAETKKRKLRAEIARKKIEEQQNEE
jgi:hypothetical protein